MPPQRLSHAEENVVDGSARAATHVLRESPTTRGAQLISGVWESQPPELELTFEGDETVHLLNGRANAGQDRRDEPGNKRLVRVERKSLLDEFRAVLAGSSPSISSRGAEAVALWRQTPYTRSNDEGDLSTDARRRGATPAGLVY